MSSSHEARSDVRPPIVAANVLTDGLYAGVIGAFIVAFWFLILDVIAGRPFYTPSMLGTVLIKGIAALDTAVVSAPMTAAYTAVHIVAFVIVGIIASYLITLFDRFPAAGVGLIFFFVFFEVGFFVFNAALGGHLLGRLGPWSVGIGNLLAAAGMAAYLWIRHPHLKDSIRHMWDE